MSMYLQIDLEVSRLAAGQAILTPWLSCLLLEASVPWHLELHSCECPESYTHLTLPTTIRV